MFGAGAFGERVWESSSAGWNGANEGGVNILPQGPKPDPFLGGFYWHDKSRAPSHTDVPLELSSCCKGVPCYKASD
jgi:hypothetical protein